MHTASRGAASFSADVSYNEIHIDGPFNGYYMKYQNKKLRKFHINKDQGLDRLSKCHIYTLGLRLRVPGSLNPNFPEKTHVELAHFGVDFRTDVRDLIENAGGENETADYGGDTERNGDHVTYVQQFTLYFHGASTGTSTDVQNSSILIRDVVRNVPYCTSRAVVVGVPDILSK
uniref:Uncharacterized protein n=1 Tax=Romanomermis culicivorax TaxID=13658 RepID=A0A915HV59_ROMCU